MMVSKSGISFSKGPPFSGEPCLFWGVYIRQVLRETPTVQVPEPPGMVLKPYKKWEKLPVPQLVSLPDFRVPSTAINC